MAVEVISGRYRIDGRLGIGGMSTVHRALDTRLERDVAVKLLAEHLAEDDTFVSRFRREALAAARLVHPNIVQVFDFGLDDATGQHFIVMELVNGSSCAELLRDERVLAVDRTLDVIAQSCRGLDHAHRHGVVHRDVKPGNLLVSDDGVVKLADFGIAKATEQSSITQVGSVLGTAAYLSPEQARGEDAGPASDIYALGVVTYQLLSGRLPYEAASLSELALKQQREAPLPLDAVNPAVPSSLARAVARALAVDAAARYADALSMGESLRAGAQGIDPPLAEAGDDVTQATQMLHRGESDRTEATRMLAPRDEVTRTRVAGPVDAARRPARAAPAPAARPRDGRGAAPRRRGARRFARMILVLLALLIIGGAALVIADDRSGRPHLRQVVQDDARQAMDQVKQIIDENTR